MIAQTQPQDVLQFWFHELKPEDWFSGSLELDQQITSLFFPLLERAAQCELVGWRDSAQGRLAEVIVLDQFSRNIYRNTPRAFSQDPLALALAQEAVNLGLDQKLPVEQRSFLYMPYMHSESATIHTQALVLFGTPGMEHNYQFELKHKAIIDQFGRYPHRNSILGRGSSEQELAFLQQPDSSF
ncbi:DUF924 domain-containing protein [Vibrio sp. JPW-9-11-11]|uniref:DUF924 family protein n=1 Tax=Vibrio sp. JPW-9-11-11 TaxID=1416532 RepID=UPI001594E1D8|nr:DUF924 family protein [Vibrio sp. JPW-9-11-11]NVD08885.1 DUF924 domain-containing protein [Vibrio sp. JPW-9-11-11]